MAENAPIKVGLLLPSLKCGGAERVVVNLAKALKEAGAQVEILLMSKEGEFLAEAEKLCTVVDLKCNKTYKLPGKLLAYFIKQRPNCFISSFWKLNLCACLARMLFPSVRVLLWEHSLASKSKNSPTWLYALSASVFYRWAYKVVAVSTGAYNDIDRWTFGLRGKLVVIFNPITPPDPRLISHAKPGSGNQVIWVGRLDVPKNPGLSLEAFALLPARCDATLVFVGEGLLRTELESRCRALGLDDRVSFLGYKANPYEFMAVSDLLILSSDAEGFGNVIVEAMHCGLRVVSTDCGTGIHEILLDNRYGTVVPCKDKYALATAIENELMARHSTNNQIDGAQRFLPQLVVQQFLAAMR